MLLGFVFYINHLFLKTMKTAISMLRGINVSGQKKILMKDLKTLYEGLGLKNVITYVQSGNVIFDYDKIKIASISKKIEDKIFENYHFNVSVINKSVVEMESVIKNNPFVKQKGIDLTRLYVSFLYETPVQTNIDKIKDIISGDDKFIISGDEVYLYCPVSYGNSKLSNNFFENKLKVTATTRNWKTVNELLRLATEK